MKIFFASSEVVPFAKTGGLADVAGALPLALETLGHEVVIALPKYKCVNAQKFGLKRLNKETSYASIGKNIKVYFIENNAYFNREGLYVDEEGDYADNLERFVFYCRRCLELLREIGFSADILHAHDWQAALIPIYLKNIYRKQEFYRDMRSMLTIHNLGYQGLFAKSEFSKLGLDWQVFNPEELEFYGKINLLKGGIVYADIINTVSPTYSKEIRGEELGFGLEGVLEERKNKLYGVLNGLDYAIWNPATDKFIAKNYTFSTIEDKLENKFDLQVVCGLDRQPEVPVLGMVSRLAAGKGLDILVPVLERICNLPLQLVILGTGEPQYHQALKKIAQKYPRSVSINLKFDDQLAHKIYAGADIFLMPSRYEPCGLGQLISLKYGTIPIVFKTGGLADTINKNNGFVFNEYNAEALFAAFKKAFLSFGDKAKWINLVSAAMRADFSWEASARQYGQLYAQAKKS